MASAMKDILVEEVMSKNPKMVPVNTPVVEGARIMRKYGVSTLILVEDNTPVGIVTDRDFVTKVVAEELEMHKTTLKDIMSSPVIMIPHDESISVAAKVMSRRRIRKLPVVKNGKIVGILSENDITRISPDLIAITQEYAKMHNAVEYENHLSEYVAGKCENCGQYSLRLRLVQGSLVCPECAEQMMD